MAMDKTFNAAEAEARISKAWEEAGALKAGANKSRDESFCIMTPPPNVIGAQLAAAGAGGGKLSRQN